jgi:hypothetical protein
MLSVLVRRRVASMCCASALAVVVVGCGRGQPQPAKEATETIARTEFTERIENFLEHEPLKPGQPSAFLIHLTDLSDGAPVEKADVTLTVRRDGDARGIETKARVGRVTGIYVAQVTVAAPGRYTIEFHVKNAKLDERMVLDGFTTGGSS